VPGAQALHAAGERSELQELQGAESLVHLLLLKVLSLAKESVAKSTTLGCGLISLIS